VEVTVNECTALTITISAGTDLQWHVDRLILLSFCKRKLVTI
jgi:hypothetical protein